jgi:cell division protease FtsH
MLPGIDPVHKVTIIPRGRALGLTWVLPERDRISQYKKQMLAQISFLFGGRIAEELFVHDISTGASNDFERATELARAMVTRFGMSDSMGPMVYGENEGEVFLGRSVTTHKNVSETTLQKVDAEIRRIIDEQYAVARKLIEDNRDKVEAMTQALMAWETIDADQISDIMAGRPPRSPKPVTAPPAAPCSPTRRGSSRRSSRSRSRRRPRTASSACSPASRRCVPRTSGASTGCAPQHRARRPSWPPGSLSSRAGSSP